MSQRKDDGTMNQQVSDTYREHSTERAPDRLNDRILAMAAAETKGPQRGFPMLESWTRPLAVAATVALSLAIVLKVTDVPDDAIPVPDVPQTLEEEFRPKDTGALDDARNQARLRSGPNRDNDTALRPETEIARPAKQERTDVAAPADSPVESAPEPVMTPPVGQAAGAPDTEAADQRQNDAQAASRSAAGSPALTSFSMSNEELEQGAKTRCDESRENADEWLACINELRRLGHEQQADAEYEQFLLRFPVE